MGATHRNFVVAPFVNKYGVFLICMNVMVVTLVRVSEVFLSLTRSIGHITASSKGFTLATMSSPINYTELIMIVLCQNITSIAFYFFKNSNESIFTSFDGFLLGLSVLYSLIDNIYFIGVFVASWFFGPSIVQLFFSATVISSLFLEKLVLWRPWYAIEVVSVAIYVTGGLIPYMFMEVNLVDGGLDGKYHVRSSKLPENVKTIATVAFFISAVLFSVRGTIGEYILTMKCGKSRENRFSVCFFNGFHAIISTLICLTAIVILSQIEGVEYFHAVNGMLCDPIDFVAKVLGNTDLMILLGIVCITEALWRWTSNQIILRINFVSERITNGLRVILYWILMVYVFENPEKTAHSFTQRKKAPIWEWSYHRPPDAFIFIQFLAFILASLVYCEIGIPSSWKRERHILKLLKRSKR